MKRYGIKHAPAGCGNEGDGACEGCVQHAVRRGRWAIRQLLPLRYVTTYHTGDGEFEVLCTWRMWLGRVFDVQRLGAPVAAITHREP